MNRANGQRIIRRVWMGNTSVKDLRAEIATKRTFSSNEREAMVRATIRSALDGILRRSEFLEQVYADGFSSADLFGVAYLEGSFHREENEETKTHWNRV